MGLLLVMFIYPLMYWQGFPLLFSATRIGLLFWCVFGFINLFVKTKPSRVSKSLKPIWFCLGFIVWFVAAGLKYYQTIPTVIVILGLILSWSWLLFYIYAISVHRAKPIIYVILIGVISSGYWIITPSGYEQHNYYAQFNNLLQIDMVMDSFRSKSNKQFPQSISELSKFSDKEFDSLLTRLEIPDYMKSREWDQLPPEVIILYEKEIQPETRFFKHASIGDKSEWKTRPRGRFVYYAGERGDYLAEEEFQEKLKTFEKIYGEKTLTSRQK